MAPNSAMKARAPDPQTECRLFSLPGEIRTYIYELVLTVPPNQDGRVVVPSARRKRFEAQLETQSRSPSKVHSPGKVPATVPEARRETVLRLLETCRLVNDEAAGIL